MRLAVLGPLEVRDTDGRPVTVGGTRLRVLAVRLALDPGRWIGAATLIDDLWDDDPPAGAANALQSLVSRLRRVLPDAVESGPAGYRLALPADQVDAVCFERLAAQGRAAGDPATAAALLGEALGLWRGPALADAAGASFATGPAARLEELRLAATEDRIEADLALGRAGAVLAELEALAAAHPLRERLRGQQVRALAATGRQADALAAYEATRTALADGLGVDPSPQLQAVQLAVLRQELSAAGARSNLRAQLTSFVGRDDEVAEMTGLLTRTRLLTLVGPGGAGKTRLASEAGARLAANGTDGVWMVELAPLSDPLDLPGAVATALGLRESILDTGATRDPLARLVDALAGRRAVLILDNCEHLVDAAARLAHRLLAECPGLTVLATSRKPLGITGETVLPVGPLAVAPAGSPAADALAWPAVRLFADRAAAARPGFTVDDANAPAVVEVCRRLDGLPLAVELAAARLRSLPVEQLAARIGDRFRLLTGGSRTALPRHQTLRAVVAWSWDLLAEPERVLTRRLAVFAGGATIEAAERVCAGPGLPAADVLGHLAALADKSILVVVADGMADGTTEARYRMLETVRDFSAERLAEAGEAEAVRAAHAGWFAELAERADPELRGAGQLAWMRRLDADRDNLLSALGWACDAGRADLAVRLGAALGWFWTVRGDHVDAAGWLNRADAVEGDAPAEARLILHVYAAANTAATTGELAPAVRALTTAVTRARDLDPPPAHPMFPLLEALLPTFEERHEEAEAAWERVAAHPDPWVRGFATIIRGSLLANEGDLDRARPVFETGRELFAGIGDRWGLAMTLSSLGELRESAGDRDGAEAAVTEAMGLVQGLGVTDDWAHLLVRRSTYRARAGRLGEARADLALAAQVEPMQASWTPLLDAGLGEVARRAGDPAEARRCFQRGLDVGATRPFLPGQLKAMLLAGLAYAALDEGDPDAAAPLLHEAAGTALASRDMPVFCAVADAMAVAALAAGDPARAAVVLGASARAALGDATYEVRYAEGAALDRDGALALLGVG